MFPYQKGPDKIGRVLRLLSSDGNNSPAEVRLKAAADAQRYDQIVCGLLIPRDHSRGSCFPLAPVSRQKAVWMTCHHVTEGRLDLEFLLIGVHLDHCFIQLLFVQSIQMDAGGNTPPPL